MPTGESSPSCSEPTTSPSISSGRTSSDFAAESDVPIWARTSNNNQPRWRCPLCQPPASRLRPGSVRDARSSASSVLATPDITSAVSGAMPVREQRNKDLQRRMRELLAATAPPAVIEADRDESRPAPRLESIDLSSRWPEFARLSENELHARCAGLFAPSFPARFQVSPTES